MNNEMNVPNLFTIFRIIIIPFFIKYLVEGRFGTALFLLILAGLSDAMDGFWARYLHKVTKLGTYMDPIADKLFLQGSFITLAVLNKIPVEVVIIVFGRDLMIFIGTVILTVIMGKRFDVSPTRIGKANTVFQIFVIFFIVLKLSLGIQAPAFAYFIYILLMCTVLCTVISGYQYVARGIEVWKRNSGNGENGRIGESANG